ncbi:MAG TPA: N-acetylmuramic acid 6-phosphate etherase [Chthoniobacterales bacterium]|nr:N-acetylmuramic acid 6-phosphate etherase [Chthoniobacterales bacterium]
MNPAERILGVEGGGTKTAWVLVEREGTELRILEQGKLPPSNFRLATPERLRSIFQQLPQQIDRAGIFLAGCVTDEDRHKLLRIASEVWPSAKILTGSDRDSGMAAALGHGEGIVVNAGSGSSVTGRRGDKIEKAGGWGHILGDVGGGYSLSIRALRLILREYDLHRGEVQLSAQMLRALSLNNLDELVRWVQVAEKVDIAMLAPVVFEAAMAGDERVCEILEDGARVLCEYTEAVASRLHLLAPKVMLLGGLFHRDSIYAHTFRRRLKKNLPDARVAAVEQPPEFGAAWLAAEMTEQPQFRPKGEAGEIEALAAALTEQVNPRSEQLEKMNARQLVDLFINEEAFVQEALRGAADGLAQAIELLTAAFRNGGRLFYVGAGSSGRLGVLDASEIPPTFGASPDLVQGIIAGGVTALHRSVEGAEDETAAGALALEQRRVTSGDVVIGISASGRTPFVQGALTHARSLGAKTVSISSNPGGAQSQLADVSIELAVGPEILTGSTRLKAGTATKVALNIISTGAMVALGKVRGNLMIDLHASNTKLRDRAVRVVAQLAGCDYGKAWERLENSGWNLRGVIGALQ